MTLIACLVAALAVAGSWLLGVRTGRRRAAQELVEETAQLQNTRDALRNETDQGREEHERLMVLRAEMLETERRMNRVLAQAEAQLAAVGEIGRDADASLGEARKIRDDAAAVAEGVAAVADELRDMRRDS